MKKLLLVLVVLYANVSWASCTVWDVHEADNQWKKAIDSNITENVVDLYEKHGILVPTFGLTIIDNQKDRYEYFKKLFKEVKDLKVHFDDLEDRHVQFIHGGAVSSGFYTFTGRAKDTDEDVAIPARFTFVYEEIKHDEDMGGCHLQLITHNSSEKPFGDDNDLTYRLTRLISQ